MKEKLEIIKSFGLQVEKLNDSLIYKVINTDKEINIDKLQWALEECILITSLEKGTEKLDTGIHTQIANVYYILLNYEDRDNAYKYDDLATQEYGETLYMPYKYNPGSDDSITTIYGDGEM